MLDTHAILIDFILILGSATIVATIFHSLHLPPIVGFLMAGILAGPHGLGLVKTLPRVEILTEIAGVLLMFTIGLEFSIRRLLALRQSLLSLGAGQMGLTIGICLPLFHYIFEFSWSQSFFFASLISLSSTAVVFKLLKDGRDLESPFGQASLSILLFQDISVIPLLLLVPFIAGGTNSSIEPFSLALLGRFLFKSIGLILFILVGTRWIVPYALERVARTRSSEVFFFAILFIGGGTALLINSIGLSLSLGAFFAGLMISSSPYGKQATAEFTPLRDNFLGLFFVAIGMLLSVQFLGTHILEILGLSISALLIKFFCIFIVLWITGHASTIALITAMMLFQVGEFSFILADQGRNSGLMSNIEYQYFLSVSIFSLALTPLLYRLAPRLGLHNSLASLIPQSFQNIAHNLRSHWIKPSPQGSTMNSQESAMGGHCLIIGFGVAGQEVASALRSLKLPYCILELNSSTVSKAKANGEPILFGDATKAEILHDAGIERAHLVILVVNSLDISVAILRTIHQIRPDVRVLIRLQYLRDLANLNLTANIDPIVSEFETSLEILSRTLKSYGADSKQIYEFTVAAQNRLRQTSEGLIGYQHRLIDLPSWQALASLYPIKLAAHSKALGKSLVELNLRRTTGASLVFAYREGMGVTIPGSDFILESEDTLYLLGTSESIESARMILG